MTKGYFHFTTYLYVCHKNEVDKVTSSVAQ